MAHVALAGPVRFFSWAWTAVKQGRSGTTVSTGMQGQSVGFALQVQASAVVSQACASILCCAVGKWTFEALVEQYGDVCFSVARPTSGQAPMLLRDYVEYMKVWRCLGCGSVRV